MPRWYSKMDVQLAHEDKALGGGGEITLQESNSGSSRRGSVETNLTSIHEDAGSFFFFFSFCYFFGLLPWHMVVPRLGDESEL